MQFLDEAQQRSILTRLIKLTRENKLTWSPGTSNSYFFRTVTKGGFLYTVSSRDRDDYPPFDLRVYLDDGDDMSPAIASISTEEFSDENDLLADLYMSAKRAALNLDNVVSKIMEDLEGLDG